MQLRTSSLQTVSRRLFAYTFISYHLLEENYEDSANYEDYEAKEDDDDEVDDKSNGPKGTCLCPAGTEYEGEWAGVTADECNDCNGEFTLSTDPNAPTEPTKLGRRLQSSAMDVKGDDTGDFTSDSGADRRLTIYSSFLGLKMSADAYRSRRLQGEQTETVYVDFDVAAANDASFEPLKTAAENLDANAAGLVTAINAEMKRYAFRRDSPRNP